MEGNYTNVIYTPEEATDAVWILTSAGFIFIMTAGFALIESGAVRRKNRSAALIKNLFNVPIAVIAFWLVGYGFGFGEAIHFVGVQGKYYASSAFERMATDQYLRWDIQLAYCMVVVTIYQGALAERT